MNITVSNSNMKYGEDSYIYRLIECVLFVHDDIYLCEVILNSALIRHTSHSLP